MGPSYEMAALPSRRLQTVTSRRQTEGPTDCESTSKGRGMGEHADKHKRPVGRGERAEGEPRGSRANPGGPVANKHSRVPTRQQSRHNRRETESPLAPTQN